MKRKLVRVAPLRNRNATACRLQSLTDDELLHRLFELLQQSRRVESELVAHIDEVDQRRLYAREASPSMFAYCTEVLHLSEHEAYLRITVARGARQHPMLLTMLADGRLHLSGIAKLATHLTRANRETLLQRVAHKSKRAIEVLIAELAPRADAPALIRKLPERRMAELPPAQSATPLVTTAFELGPDRVAKGAETAPAQAAVMEPLARARYNAAAHATDWNSTMSNPTLAAATGLRRTYG